MNWDAAGMVLPVAVGLPLATLQHLRQTGQPIPASVEVQGLIDSGSDIGIISPDLVQHFGLMPIRGMLTTTTIGSQSVSIYEISMVLMGPAGLAGPTLVRAGIYVMGSPTPLPQQLDMLIGQDILRTCVLHSDGPSNFFTLSF